MAPTIMHKKPKQVGEYDPRDGGQLNLTYTDPQPRDGGAPNPGAMFSLSTMAGDEAQPRDGG
ncbi:hypothetical protein A1F94_003199 [Pyrenophora tritici-repentis]|nr:hypothetical protein A1F94_003199 [Pyrenophora tritici-repentis]